MRKILRLMITAFLLSSIIIGNTITSHAAVYRLGDTDRDGEVTITDATVIQRLLVEMIEDNDGHILRCGDIDGGGTVVTVFIPQIKS